MSDRTEDTRGTPSLDLAERFWRLWRMGQRPDASAYLAVAAVGDLSDIVAVLRIDQRERWLAGEPILAEHYLQAHPGLVDQPERALELIYCEVLLREELGQRPTLAEYQARFPAHADRLRQQFEVGGGLGAATESGPTAWGAEGLPATWTGLAAGAAGPAGPAIPLPALPGYEVVRELGRGGMGVVYLARDLRSRTASAGREVALKVMQWLDPVTLYRFKSEFRTLAGLNHPNLVNLYELVQTGGQWFFTMELLQGTGLLAHVRGPANAWRGQPLTPGEEVRLRDALGQLADGLLALHGAGKLHRDVKPGNVMVTPEGRVVLLDFGLAADLDPSGRYRSAHPHLLGTVCYMAPEQAACLPLTPAADWYAMGAVLYEALTGRAPFEGAPLEVLLRKREEDPPGPGTVVPDLPEDLAALCMELLRRDPAARPAGAEVRRRLGASRAPATAAPTPEDLLVGRAHHLEALGEALAAVRGGATVVMSVAGRSGAGKTALVRRFAAVVTGPQRGGTVVLAGRCYEQESVPYKALDSLVDALSRHLDGLPAAVVPGLLPRDVAALTRLFPVLRRVEAVAKAPQGKGDSFAARELRRRGVAALRELLARMADRWPLVLIIDDLQWGDEDSAALLADLLQPPGPPALLLVGCYRSEDAEASPCVRAFRRLVLAGAPLVGRDLAVEPLDEAERRELALALLGPSIPQAPGQAEVIARQSGGFPFFVHELVRYLGAGRRLGGSAGAAGDVTLGEVLWDRVLELAQGARALLEVVAVAGRPIRRADACAAAGLADGESALQALRGARLLRGAGPSERDEVETYHDRIRESVLAHLDAEARRGHHLRLAEVLQSTEPPADPEMKAIHWLGAGERERAGGYYVQAAEQAREALAFDRAAKLYRQALELRRLDEVVGDERRLRAHLADALAGAGHGGEAAREYLAAAALAPEAEALDLRRRAALQYLSSGHVDEGLTALRQVLAAVGLAMPATPRRAFWGLVWQRLKLRLRGLGFRRQSERDVPPQELRCLDACSAAAVGLSMVDTIQGAYFQTRALLLALRAGEPGRLVSALALEGAHQAIGGRRAWGRAARLVEVAEALAQELDEPYRLAMVSLWRGVAAALAGDWLAGRAQCDQAEGIFRASCTGVMWELGTAHRFALWPLLYLGDLQEIRRRLPGLIKEARQRDDLYEETNLCLVIRTMLRLADDDPALARREVAELMARWSQQGFHVQHMNRLFDEVQIDLYEDEGERAWRRIAEHWPLIERSHLLRVQQVRIFLRHLRGRAALAAGVRVQAARDAKALWRERVAWAEALAALLEAGLAGKAPEAQVRLRDAAARCTEANLHLYAAAARRLLGERTAGAAGQALVDEADGWMARQGAKKPGQLARLLVPRGQFRIGRETS
jgi:hypothetical protein